MIAESLITVYGYNATVVNNQMADITHEESLIVPAEGANTINWLLGHLVSARYRTLEVVQAELVWDDATRALYGMDSAPITAETEYALPIDTLLEAFNQSHERLVAKLETMSDADLSAPSMFRHDYIYQSLQYLHFHEAYHIGQLTMVAAVLGKSTAYVS